MPASCSSTIACSLPAARQRCLLLVTWRRASTTRAPRPACTQCGRCGAAAASCCCAVPCCAWTWHPSTALAFAAAAPAAGPAAGCQPAPPADWRAVAAVCAAAHRAGAHHIRRQVRGPAALLASHTAVAGVSATHAHNTHAHRCHSRPCIIRIALSCTTRRCCRYAVGTKGWVTFQGGWAWSLKDYIDRAFMAKYGDGLNFEMAAMAQMQMAQPQMSQPAPASAQQAGGGTWWWWWPPSWFGRGRRQQQAQQLPGAFAAAGPEGAELLAAAAMRCGGCGAKVGSSTLARALRRINAAQPPAQQQQTAQQQPGSVLLGVGDDAAVLAPPPPGHVSVSTLDFFRAFTQDAFTLGAIAANHALGVRPGSVMRRRRCCAGAERQHTHIRSACMHVPITVPTLHWCVLLPMRRTATPWGPRRRPRWRWRWCRLARRSSRRKSWRHCSAARRACWQRPAAAWWAATAARGPSCQQVGAAAKPACSISR